MDIGLRHGLHDVCKLYSGEMGEISGILGTAGKVGEMGGSLGTAVRWVK